MRRFGSSLTTNCWARCRDHRVKFLWPGLCKSSDHNGPLKCFAFFNHVKWGLKKNRLGLFIKSLKTWPFMWVLFNPLQVILLNAPWACLHRKIDQNNYSSVAPCVDALVWSKSDFIWNKYSTHKADCLEYHVQRGELCQNSYAGQFLLCRQDLYFIPTFYFLHVSLPVTFCEH